MFCRFCGKSVKDGSRFCVYCGKKLAIDEDERIPDQQSEKIRPETYQTYRAAPKPDSRNVQSSRPNDGIPSAQGTRQQGMQSAQRPRRPMAPPQGSGRHYFSSEQRTRQTELQTDEIMRQTDIQLEQRARQADIQREQEKLASDIQVQAGPAEQGTGRIYSRAEQVTGRIHSRQNDDRPDGDRQPFEGKRRRKGTAKKSRLPLLIALIAVIAALGAAVWFFVVPMFTSSGAEDTITRLEEALNERDNDKLLKCFDRETNALNENAFASGTANAGFDLKISETFETDSDHMTAYVTFKIRYNGEVESVLVPLPMVKEGKNWYITKAGWDNVCGEIPARN